MNLSHPEQYLAPILSAMERVGGDIPLHGGGAEYRVPSSIAYPRNLVLIGTVNMDETTMGISDKVLDRAFTLEFWDVDVNAWPGWDRERIESPAKESLRPTILVAPDGRECRLLVDDEPLSQIESGRNEWEWQPGFYAGEVRVELLDRNDLKLGTWCIDVSSERSERPMIRWCGWSACGAGKATFTKRSPRFDASP